MAGVPVPGYQAFWAENRASLQAEYKEIKKQYPDAETQYRRLFNILCDIEDVASFTPAAVGESAEWAAIVSAANDNRVNYCKVLSSKTLFSALYGNYTVTLNELKSLVRPAHQAQKNQPEKKASKKFEGGNDIAQPSPPRLQTNLADNRNQKIDVTTRNYSAPLRVTSMDTDTPGAETTTLEEEISGKEGRPPQ
jgi:hypothetical protein